MVEDDYLLEIFERAAGDPPSARAALEQLRPRIRRAHRRRAVMRGSAGLVVLVVLGGLLSQTTSQPSQHVRVGDTGTTAAIDSTSTSLAPSTTLEAPEPPQTPAASVTTIVSGTAGDGGGSGSATAAPATSTAAPSSAPASAPAKPAATKPATKSPASAPAGGSAGSPSVAAPQVTSFDGQGGSVEVQYTDTSMNLQAVSPSPGWSVADTKSDGASIEVTFQSDDGSATGIEVHLDDAGRPTVDTPVEPVGDDVANGLAGS
jgi:hypothetical protein